jgi:hypothetical protein
VTEAQAQIQQFLQQCRTEREQTANKLKEVEILAQQSLTEVERLASRNADLENRLRQVESNFDTVSRADIQNIYKDASL